MASVSHPAKDATMQPSAQNAEISENMAKYAKINVPMTV
jgi:hypothetical protein